MRALQLPLLGSNQDSPAPEAGVLPVTPRGITISAVPSLLRANERRISFAPRPPGNPDSPTPAVKGSRGTEPCRDTAPERTVPLLPPRSRRSLERQSHTPCTCQRSPAVVPSPHCWSPRSSPLAAPAIMPRRPPSPATAP